MSQRGGSVVTYVKYGEKVYSPIIDRGEADVVIAFELLEAYRALPYLKKGGKMIVNTQRMNPMPVITGAAEYPEGLLDKLGEASQLTAVNARELAEDAGNIKAVNVVLIGVMARLTDGISKETWHSAVRATSKEKFADVNIKAFEAGYGL